MLRNDNVIPRLSAGAGDGVNRMCGMQVISWINGDTEITEFPSCSARPLAILVQRCNDDLADPITGYLSPEDSLLVLDLASQTVGTSELPDLLMRSWSLETVHNPDWGVARYATGRERALLFNAVSFDSVSVISCASYATKYRRLVEFTRGAITCWRRLAELDTPANVDAAVVDDALKAFEAHQ